MIKKYFKSNNIVIGHGAGINLTIEQNVVILGDNIVDLNPDNNKDVLFLGKNLAIGETILGEKCNLKNIVKKFLKEEL